MPKMKWGDNEPDWDELDDAEYDEEGGFSKYDGPIPPKNTILNGTMKKLWATDSQAGNKMFKVLWEAEGNSGEKKKYNGLTIWENVVWTPQTKFRWQPWLDALNLTLRDVRQKTVTAEDEDNVGTPILRIGKLKFTSGVDIRIVTDTDTYNGEKRAKVGEWLPPGDDSGDDDEGEDYDEDDGDDAPF